MIERERERWLGDRSIERERETSGGGKGEILGEREREREG